MKLTISVLLTVLSFLSCHSQTSDNKNTNLAAKEPGGMAVVANQFLKSLSSQQKDKIQFAFNSDERYNWHYIPKGRKGLALKELSDAQRNVALALLQTALSDTGFKKTTSIIKLEAILREVEGRQPDDDYRDPGKYYVSIFGEPATDSIWGWRLEGHHISLNFSVKKDVLISATPGFLGTNPAIVLSGPDKGLFILKNELALGLQLLHSLDATQLKKAIISDQAPAEIITEAKRKAMIDKPQGIQYSELNVEQQKFFMQLLSLYIHRYTKLFAETMMKEIEAAGLNDLRFAWAGGQQPGPGSPHYYRIQGPTIIIEYDNTQNNANHIHTVIRDLKNDFGDQLLQHFEKNH